MRTKALAIAHAHSTPPSGRLAPHARPLGTSVSNRLRLRALGIQPKLEVSSPDDEYEREADNVADKVMRMPAQASAPLRLSRVATQAQRMCAECEEEEKGPLQREAKGTASPGVVPGHPIPDAGTSLTKSARAFFEPRFGRDLSDVRVHTGHRAAAVADSLQARAFTYGRHIVFGAGEYAPGTSSGRQLLAHELAHTIQQGHCGDRVQRRVNANFVSCRTPTAAQQAIVGADPVATLGAANTHAVSMMDSAIDELAFARNAILGGAEPGWPTIGDATATSLLSRMRIDASNRAVWTGTGIGSVQLLIRRLRMVRNLLDGGGLRYTCLGGANVTVGACSGPGCVGAVRAVSCDGTARLVLCAPFWSDSADDQAGTLMHESFHIFFGFVGDTGHEGNAHCYEQLTFDLSNVAINPLFVGSCPA